MNAHILQIYILLEFTDWGIISIAVVSSIVSIICVFALTAPYAAICLKEKWFAFYTQLLLGALILLKK